MKSKLNCLKITFLVITLPLIFPGTAVGNEIPLIEVVPGCEIAPIKHFNQFQIFRSARYTLDSIFVSKTSMLSVPVNLYFVGVNVVITNEGRKPITLKSVTLKIQAPDGKCYNAAAPKTAVHLKGGQSEKRTFAFGISDNQFPNV